MDHGVKVASVLANSFSRRCSYIAESDAHVKEKAIQFGFVLGKWWGRGQRVSPRGCEQRTRKQEQRWMNKWLSFLTCSDVFIALARLGQNLVYG